MRLTLGAIIAIIAIFGGLILATNVWQHVDANKIMVVQSPVKGRLTWHTTPGIKWQGFGKCTTYDKRESYEFETPVRFNDGGHGTMVGSIQYELPLDKDHLTELHVRFGSQKSIETQLIQTIVNKSIYMTGPLMSSKESYAEKRNYLLSYVEDQIQHGVYKTTQKEVKTTDPLTNAEKIVTLVEISIDSTGMPMRQDKPVLQEFGIRTFNFAISSLPYDAAVESQIKQQQKITMDVQTAIASAKQAEQDAITAGKRGEANAATAKWEQEVIKAKAVTLAEQQKEVAKLEKDAAEFEKQKLILQGEGEAAKKRAIMSADGALDKKLDAWREVNFKYAEAIKGSHLVPTVVMGENGGKTSSANDWIQLFMAKTAKDLALDMSVPSGK